MHYDGLAGAGSRFEFFPLSQTRRATKGRMLNRVAYEVLDKDEPRNYANANFDWNHAFAADNAYYPGNVVMSSDEEDNQLLKEMEGSSKKPKKTNEDKEYSDVGSIDEKLNKLSKEIKGKKTTKKKKTTPTKASSPRQSYRIPPGFSVRQHIQKRGPKPVCQGCSKPIGYTDKCLRYGFKQRQNHKYIKTMQYHCTPQCLMKMELVHLEEFLDKSWTDKDLIAVAKEIEKAKKKEE